MEVMGGVMYKVVCMLVNNINTYRHFTILKDGYQRTYICKYDHKKGF